MHQAGNGNGHREERQAADIYEKRVEVVWRWYAQGKRVAVADQSVGCEGNAKATRSIGREDVGFCDRNAQVRVDGAQGRGTGSQGEKEFPGLQGSLRVPDEMGQEVEAIEVVVWMGLGRRGKVGEDIEPQPFLVGHEDVRPNHGEIASEVVAQRFGGIGIDR